MWSPITRICIFFNDQNPHASQAVVQIPFRIQSRNLFHPGKSRNQNPMHSLGRWTSILKRGIRLCSINPQNYRPVSLRATASSLRATTLSIPVLRGSLIMDAERLHSDIGLNSEMIPFPQNTSTISQTPKWTLDPDGFYATSTRIYVLNSGQSPTPCSSVLT